MSEQTTAVAGDDTAWASVNTPLNAEALGDFCRDIERLFRINPMLEFREWQNLGNGRYRMSVRNISQDPPFELQTELQSENHNGGLTIYYCTGLKRKTVFSIEPLEHGSKLTITDDYSGQSEEIRKKRLHEVDKSLVSWAEYLQRYLILWQRWSRFGWWRWYMAHIWQPMKPTGRRITYILLMITLAEIALIALGTTIYYIEYR